MTTRAPIIIPAALKPLATEKRWVVWKWVTGKNGKRTKPPFRADAPGRHASSTDAGTWRDLKTAMLAYTEGKADGIGFVLTGSDIAAFDLDHCRDSETGTVHPWARDLVRRCGSYCEITPSGEGLRIIGLGKGPPVHRKFVVPGADGLSVEIYRKAERYITITGLQIDDAIKAMAELDAPAEAVASDLDDAKHEKPRTNGGTAAGGKRSGNKQHDLEALIRDGCGDDFGGDRSRAVWFVINTLLKQGNVTDEIVAVLLDRSNGISAHVYDQSKPEDYARKQVEKAQREQANDPDAEIARLARLPPLDYEQQRKEAADRLDVRTSFLDRMVEAERVKLGLDDGDGRQGHAIELPEPEPWPEPVDGADLLDGIADAIRKHVVMSDASRDTAALWVVYAYLLDHFLVSPRLGVRSPTKRCGKTTLLDVLGRLVPRPLPTANVTPAAIFRVIEAHRPTLLVDEADTFLYDNDELRGVLNSGHRKGGTVLRTIGDDHEPRAFATYSACVIALIGALPDTLNDRALTMDLKRRLPSEAIEPFRPDRASHLDELARKAARWTQDRAEAIAAKDPVMPGSVVNREADNWRPLLAIAEVAAGHWPERAQKAVLAAHAAAGDDDASRLELLLGDIRKIFTDRNVPEIASRALVKALLAIEGRPWAEMGKSRKPLTQNRLARILRAVAIVPEKIGPEKKRVAGYLRVHFEEAFARYLEPEGGFKADSRTKCDETGTSDIFKADSPDPGCPVAKCEKPNNGGPLSGCPVAKGGAGEKVTRLKSDDLPYRGPVVAVPDLPPDTLDQHGEPVTAAPDPAGLGEARRRELAEWCRRWEAEGEDPADLEDALRMTVREEVGDRNLVEPEVARVMAIVRAGGGTC